MKSSEEGHQPSSLGTRSPGAKSEEEADVEVSKVTLEPERPTSTVKFASHLEVADIPSRSRSSLGPSRLSLMDEHGKPSRTSVTTGTTGTEGMVFGRDAVVEREKINEEARNTFAVMDLRYKDMVQDLIDLDNAFELGLLSGSRQDFEDKIQGMKIVKTPPSSAGGKATVEVQVKDNVQDTDMDKRAKAEVCDTEENIQDISETEAGINADEIQSTDNVTNVGNDVAKESDTDKPESSKGNITREKSDIDIIVTDTDEAEKSG